MITTVSLSHIISFNRHVFFVEQICFIYMYQFADCSLCNYAPFLSTSQGFMLIVFSQNIIVQKLTGTNFFYQFTGYTLVIYLISLTFILIFCYKFLT